MSANGGKSLCELAPKLMAMAMERKEEQNDNWWVSEMHDVFRKYMLQLIVQAPFRSSEDISRPCVHECLVSAVVEADKLLRQRFPQITGKSFVHDSSIHGLSKRAERIEHQLCDMVSFLPDFDLSRKKKITLVALFLTQPSSRTLAKRFLMATVDGLYDHHASQMYLNERMSSDSEDHVKKVATHELIHSYTHERFRKRLRRFEARQQVCEEEGFTELLTRQIFAKELYPRIYETHSEYDEHVEYVSDEYIHVSVEDMARAMFQGEIQLLEKDVESEASSQGEVQLLEKDIESQESHAPVDEKDIESEASSSRVD